MPLEDFQTKNSVCLAPVFSARSGLWSSDPFRPSAVSASIADNPTTPSNYTMKVSARICDFCTFVCGNGSKSSSEIEGLHAGLASACSPPVSRFGGLASAHAKAPPFVTHISRFRNNSPTGNAFSQDSNREKSIRWAGSLAQRLGRGPLS